MSNELKIEAGEKLNYQGSVRYLVDDTSSTEEACFAVSNVALYLPAKRAGVARIPLADIREMRVRLIKDYRTFIAIFCSGAVGLALPVMFSGAADKLQIAILLFVILCVITGASHLLFRGRQVLEVTTRSKIHRWKGPLVSRAESESGRRENEAILDQLHKVLTACERSGVRVARMGAHESVSQRA